MVNQGGEPFDYDASLTPYAEGINDACDNPDVHVIAVKGNTRSAKTVSAENMVLRNATFGPLKNVLWFMQDEDALNDYIDERGEEMLRIHPEVNEKIDWADKKTGRTRKKIGKSLWLWRAATSGALRAKAAPVIVADEIDAYRPKIRDAIMTLVTSRQEEFGTAAKAYLCSHPDAGPEGGIDKVLKDSILHLWFVKCPYCGTVSSPAKEVVEWERPRITWNVPDLMGLASEMDHIPFLDHISDNVHLVCPGQGCGTTYGPDDRLMLMNKGQWLQQHQVWEDDNTITGVPRVGKVMGFVIHAFMAPFVKLAETARDWAAAKIDMDNTGKDTHFREVVVKKLGETPQSAKAEEQMETWKVVQARLASPYKMATVPTGCQFLTAFVDVQGDRFEVRVIGWDLAMQSWLIDAFPIKQWPAFNGHMAFDTIDPANRLTDWDIIEEAVMFRSYPLASNPQRIEAGLEPLFLPIAKTVVNNAGQPGVVTNAYQWVGNMLGRTEGRLVQQYQILLMQGSASKKGDMYPKAKAKAFDNLGKPLMTPVMEVVPNVHDIKRIISTRMKIEAPGPGRMHMPHDIPGRFYKELTAEHLVDDVWTKRFVDNETWDGFVACEVARDSLKPNRAELWGTRERPSTPSWATPRPAGHGLDDVISQQPSIFDRLLKLNSGE